MEAELNSEMLVTKIVVSCFGELLSKIKLFSGGVSIYSINFWFFLLNNILVKIKVLNLTCFYNKLAILSGIVCRPLRFIFFLLSIVLKCQACFTSFSSAPWANALCGRR